MSPPDGTDRPQGDRQSDRIVSFDAFYPFYLGQHSRRGCRILHYLGTSSALALAIGAASLGRPRLLLVALVVGYLPAWLAHLIIEKNRPATFRYPLWSLLADFKMLAQAIRQRRV
jgi:hypothetical protein